MTRDEAIKYNALYQEVELAIVNIGNLGFDVTEFKKALKEIHNTVNENVKYKYVKGMAEASYIQSYSSGINELNKLKNKLDNYYIYVRAQNACDYIGMKINSNISDNELDKLISKMIYILKSINKSATIDYDNEKHIVEKIYETAYNVIKLEITVRAESQLYLFVKNEDLNISYFNNLILKDVEKIDLKDKKNNLIKTKLYELGEKGIYSNYLDLELIKLILISSNGLDLKGMITDKIKVLCDKIEESDKEILKQYKMADVKGIEKELALIAINRAKKEYKKRMISLLLSISIITSGFVGIPFISKRLSKNHEYKITQYTYSSDSDISNVESDNMLLFGIGTGGDHFRYVYLDTYNKNDDSFVGRINISYLELEDIYAYIDYIKEHQDEFFKDGDNTYCKIEMKDYQETDTNSTHFLLSLLLYICYLMGLMFFCGITLLQPFDMDKIKKLKKEINEGTINLNELLTIIGEYLDKIMMEVNENDNLRKKFKQLYNDNLFLLQDNEELLKRINLLFEMNKIDEVKKYVREKK